MFSLFPFFQHAKLTNYFNNIKNIPAISTAALLQKNPEATGFDPTANIKGLHEKPADENVWQGLLPGYRQVIQQRFSSGYAASLIKN